jgi:hypothetical protein
MTDYREGAKNAKKANSKGISSRPSRLRGFLS